MDNVLLVCPGPKPAGRVFQRMSPLVLLPVFGRTLLDRILEKLAREGACSVVVASSDRPGEIRGVLKESHTWGMDVTVCKLDEDYKTGGALERFRELFPAAGEIRELLLEDSHDFPAALPGDIHLSNHQFFEKAFEDSKLVGELTMREASEGVWLSRKASVHPSVVLEPPTWIGPGVKIGADGAVGPGAVIERGAFVDRNAIIRDSWVGPDTYVGRGVELRQSHVWGSGISRWCNGRFFEMEDSFFLEDLGRKRKVSEVDLVSRFVALLIMLGWTPRVAIELIFNRRTGEKLLGWKNVLLPVPGQSRIPEKTTRLKRLNFVSSPLSRWPELFEVVRGRMTLIGMRPMSLGQISGLRGEAARCWRSYPAAVFSSEEVAGTETGAPGLSGKRFKLLIACLGRRKQLGERGDKGASVSSLFEEKTL